MNTARRLRLSPVCTLLLVASVASFLTGCSSQPKKFDTPEQAADALVSAARQNSTTELREILGPDSDDLLSSGDQVADELAVKRFVEDYDQKHQLVRESDRNVSFVVGDQDWPLPIPIVRTTRGDKWYFDTEAGRDELINRRIGRNELNAIEVCLAIVDAQREYARRDPQGAGIPLYAARFASSPGAKDGLYWPAAEGEEQSPLGLLVAVATEEGYVPRAAGEEGPRPYHGYMYRLLKAQGPSAPGGEFEYIIDGQPLGGFAVVAFPAEYQGSGIKTFIVSHVGIVYERDLADDTDSVARQMSVFDPGPGWNKVRSSDDVPAASP